tara:strand:- start:6506 stop:6907 length:402 start_codon:yes stop_codon:yes gene_type:complete
MTEIDIFIQRDSVRTRILQDKEILKSLNDKIEMLYLERAKNQLSQEKKDFGTTYVVDNNKKVKVVLRKKVDWDQAQLKHINDSMRSDLADFYVKKKLLIDERTYKSAPPDLKKLFDEARTTSISSTQIEIVGE